MTMDRHEYRARFWRAAVPALAVFWLAVLLGLLS